MIDTESTQDASESDKKPDSESDTQACDSEATAPDTAAVDSEQENAGARSVEQEQDSEQDEGDAEEQQVLTPEQRIEELEVQLEKAGEDVLRAHAEVQNARRRAANEVEKARKFALERFVGDLLPVVDNLDRALGSLDSEDDANKAVVEGIELTQKSFLDTLSKNQVDQIDPAGEPFDPEFHQAMTMVPNPNLEPNTVMEVFQKGYKLNGRLIRPAMVVVSKAAD